MQPVADAQWVRMQLKMMFNQHVLTKKVAANDCGSVDRKRLTK
jgi:hypothetical protein